MTNEFVQSLEPGTEITFLFKHPEGCCGKMTGGIVIATASGNIVKDFNGMNIIPVERYDQYTVVSYTKE
jgi:hypothetical protein